MHILGSIQTIDSTSVPAVPYHDINPPQLHLSYLKTHIVDEKTQYNNFVLISFNTTFHDD